MMTQKEVQELSYEIIGCAIEVHKELGPGLLESIYEKCMKHLLIQNGFLVKSQVHIPLYFKGMELDCDLRLDLLVEDSIIVEVKATEGIVPVHVAQLMTYLKLLDKPKGLLINFNCVNIKDNLKSVVTEKFAFLG